MSTALIAVAVPAALVLGFGLGAAVTAGLITGYLWDVLFITHAIIGVRAKDRIYIGCVMHHHDLTKSGNYGVTTVTSDRVFGTLNCKRSPDPIGFRIDRATRPAR